MNIESILGLFAPLDDERLMLTYERFWHQSVDYSEAGGYEDIRLQRMGCKEWGI